MLILQAVILDLVQGLTEFIPVSSSAHLIIVPWLFRWTDQALTACRSMWRCTSAR